MPGAGTQRGADAGAAGIRISILSLQDLNGQIGHNGATWLDRGLVSRQRIVLAAEGFGKEVKAALEQRRQALASMGHVSDLGDGRLRAPGFDPAA